MCFVSRLSELRLNLKSPHGVIVPFPRIQENSSPWGPIPNASLSPLQPAPGAPRLLQVGPEPGHLLGVVGRLLSAASFLQHVCPCSPLHPMPFTCESEPQQVSPLQVVNPGVLCRLRLHSPACWLSPSVFPSGSSVDCFPITLCGWA